MGLHQPVFKTDFQSNVTIFQSPPTRTVFSHLVPSSLSTRLFDRIADILIDHHRLPSMCSFFLAGEGVPKVAYRAAASFHDLFAAAFIDDSPTARRFGIHRPH